MKEGERKEGKKVKKRREEGEGKKVKEKKGRR
jgi:hypothetical protein